MAEVIEISGAQRSTAGASPSRPALKVGDITYSQDKYGYTTVGVVTKVSGGVAEHAFMLLNPESKLILMSIGTAVTEEKTIIPAPLRSEKEVV